MNIAEAKKVPINTLHEDPANVRKHGDRNRSAVRASLQEFGQVEPLVVESGTGRVLGGNCRLAELRALGIPEVLVVEIDVHGVDATRLALALNQTAVLAEWDDEGLKALLRALVEDGLSAPGFDDAEIAKLLDEAGAGDAADTTEQLGGLEYRVLVLCTSETHQAEVLERLESEGLKCQPLIS